MGSTARIYLSYAWPLGIWLPYLHRCVDDLEVLYENDEVAVITHSAKNPETNGQVMACATKRDGKFSHWRIVRQVV